MNSIIIKFNRKVGDIPKDSLGILRMGVDGKINFNRVFIPRHYISLNANVLPCYDMPISNESWSQVSEFILTETEKQILYDLDNEILEKEKVLIGPCGILIRTLGI